MFTVPLYPTLIANSLHTGSKLVGHAIVDSSIRLLTLLFFNAHCTDTFIVGAIWSSWIFWRVRVLLNRALGNILIATKAIVPTFGGSPTASNCHHPLCH